MDRMYTADGTDRDYTGGRHCPYGDKRSCIQDDKCIDDLWDTAAVDLRVVHLGADLGSGPDLRKHVLDTGRNCFGNTRNDIRTGKVAGYP